MKKPFTREQKTTIVYGILCVVLLLVVLQLWLLTATMNAYLGGDTGVVWPAAIASLICFLLNHGALRQYAAVGFSHRSLRDLLRSFRLRFGDDADLEKESGSRPCAGKHCVGDSRSTRQSWAHSAWDVDGSLRRAADLLGRNGQLNHPGVDDALRGRLLAVDRLRLLHRHCAGQLFGRRRFR